MKQDLYRPEGIELRIPARRGGPYSRRSFKARFIVGGAAAAGLGYLMAQLSVVAVLTILGALVLLLAGLIGVAAWSLDNIRW